MKVCYYLIIQEFHPSPLPLHFHSFSALAFLMVWIGEKWGFTLQDVFENFLKTARARGNCLFRERNMQFSGSEVLLDLSSPRPLLSENCLLLGTRTDIRTYFFAKWKLLLRFSTLFKSSPRLARSALVNSDPCRYKPDLHKFIVFFRQFSSQSLVNLD